MDLHTAAENGNLDTVKILLLQSDYSPHVKSLAQDVAIDSRHQEIACYIDSYHSKEKKQLYSASQNGDPSKIEKLLSRYNYAPSTVNVALAEAAATNSVEAMKCLIARGADPRWGEDLPLIIAAEAGGTEAVEFLLSVGADINAQDNAPSHRAAKNGYLETLAYFLSKKNYTHTDRGYALTMAAKEGQLKIVGEALRNAAQACRIHVVRYLLTKRYPSDGNITANDPLMVELLHDMLPNTKRIEDIVDDLEFKLSMIAHVLLEDMGEDLVNTITRYY